MFFIEIFKKILNNHRCVDKAAECVERLFSNKRDAAAAAALLFLIIAYQTVFRNSISSIFDAELIGIIGVLSILLFAATRVSKNNLGKLAFPTNSWFETALTTWMMMLFALFIVHSTLGLIIHVFPNLLG